VDRQQHALHLAIVERIIRAVAITPLPKTPAPVLGVVNVQGRIVPVVSLRLLCGLPGRDLDVSDQFIIAHSNHFTLALVVDSVVGVVSGEELAVVATDQVLPGMDRVEALAKSTTGITILHDLDRLLERSTVALLQSALQAAGNAPV
jgi:purine-binding chemotaxis protein CheW